MKSNAARYTSIQDHIEDLDRKREAYILESFAVLESLDPDLAERVVLSLGSRRAAAYWMARPSKALGGKSAYAVLGAGDAEQVWRILDEMSFA